MKTDNENLNYRHELKYLVTSAQVEILKNRIKGIMQPDPHTSDTGKYNIRSLYFDDYRDSCFYDVENGYDPKTKYRIRIYDNSSQHIKLEKKRKENGKTLKTSCPLTVDQTEQLMDGKYLTGISEQPKVLQGLTEEMMTHHMLPKVIVEYERFPYIYSSGNVRVTFDTCMSSSYETRSFFCENIQKRPVLPTGLQLLEVKFDEYLPDVIYRILQLDNLQQTAFSKYYLCRKNTI